MSYIINKYNGDQVAIVTDGTIDTTLDVKLIGKNYAGYGETQNENLVFMLENFAHTSAPSKPMKGQIWFDSGTSKLKFFDTGAKWRTTGGAEIGPTPPLGLTIGDFWFDTLNKQLNAWDGATYVLVGPQAAGTATTEMVSKNVQDTNDTSHPIIAAMVNGETVFIISHDAEFTLANTHHIDGYGSIQKGITLRNTYDTLNPGQTSTDARFWGTTTNSDRLGGFLASEFVRTNAASFANLVNFSDNGYTVGSPTARLRVFNDSQTTPTISNIISDTIVFKTTNTATNVTETPLVLKNANILPGANLNSDIGSTNLQFNSIYATTLVGTANQASALAVGTAYKTASIATSPGTIVARTSTTETVNGVTITAGSIRANYFVGVATTAYYADLAEKYLADSEYDPGTVVMVGGDAEVTAANVGSTPIGVVSLNPAYMMNSELIGGTYIALAGRVPVKVVGVVNKGDLLVATDDGIAIVSVNSSAYVFAIALESSENAQIKLIESVIL